MSYFLQHQQNNIWHGKFSLFPEAAVAHCISTRLGGVSDKPYASLNLGLHVGDEPSKVRDNRRLLLQSLNLKPSAVCTPEQIHGDKVARVTAQDAGRGSLDYADCIPGTDALITSEPELPLMLCYADCTPILFFDPENLAIGIAHGGWKGTAASIAKKTLLSMEIEFGTKPEECLAAVGPAIGASCYTVGDEVAGIFRQNFPAYADKILTATENVWHLDLAAAYRYELLDAGILPENLESAETCTACENQWYFSHRKEGGHTGRHAAVMALRRY